MKISKLFSFVLAFVTFISVQASYHRIISLAPSLTKNVYALDAKDKLVGCTSYCYDAKHDSIEIVASAIKIGIEKIVSLKPDLVITTTLTNAEDIALIKKFGIKVEVFNSPKNFNEICTQFTHLGKLLGKEKEAAEIISYSEKKVQEIMKLHEASNQKDFFFQIGAEPIFSVLDNTFMADYISIFNGTNIASGMNTGIVGREKVISENPDVILITTMGIAGENEKEVWESFEFLKAAKNDQIFIIDSDMACTPSPTSFVQTVVTIHSLLSE
jgi:ABC-type Fe3+-hydroxamate transport system substrate-binding protein